jgi:hypothetical protein
MSHSGGVCILVKVFKVGNDPLSTNYMEIVSINISFHSKLYSYILNVSKLALLKKISISLFLA